MANRQQFHSEGENKMAHQRKFLNSVAHALRGLKNLITERNFLIQFIIGAVVLILSFLLGLTSIEKIIVVLCIAIVLGSEAVNSAFERFLDFVSPEHREEVGLVKDIMAAAVLIFSVAALIIGIYIFGRAIVL